MGIRLVCFRLVRLECKKAGIKDGSASSPGTIPHLSVGRTGNFNRCYIGMEDIINTMSL